MSLTRTTFAQMANSTRPAPPWLMAAAVTTLIVAGVLTSRPEGLSDLDSADRARMSGWGR